MTVREPNGNFQIDTDTPDIDVIVEKGQVWGQQSPACTFMAPPDRDLLVKAWYVFDVPPPSVCPASFSVNCEYSLQCELLEGHTMAHEVETDGTTVRWFSAG